MDAALSASRTCGLERVELAVFADNLRTRRLYERMGFVAEGRRPNRAKFDGLYRDEILMGRDLA
jgi:RimJ/RimL family protein N-acetyltransferase